MRLPIDNSDWCPECGERRCECGPDDGLTPAERRRLADEERAERIIADREWDRLSGGTLV